MKDLITILTIIFTSMTVLSQDLSDEQYMNAYIVVSDTSQDYFELKKKMFDLKDNLQIKIDTMDRGYNVKKNLICLTDDHEDDIYAGDYFPRRFPSETLSLEYLDYYKNGEKPTGGTIALVTLITEDKEKAEKNLIKVKKYSNSAFIINTKIYMGCMH